MTGDNLAERLLSKLRERGETVAVAESLTGGMVGTTLTEVAGASHAFRGGVIAYATQAKAHVLGVPDEVLAAHGAVSAEAAGVMAASVREMFDATYGVALTGVAGPEPQEGKPAGLVYVGVSGPQRARVVPLQLAGDRTAIRIGATRAALSALEEELAR